MKNIIITTWILFSIFVFTSCNNQNKTNEIEINKEKQAVEKIMKNYKDAIQALKTDGLENLFTDNSQVYESGGDEGSFAHYLEHHLAPELVHFKSFKFTDYTIDTEINMPFAFVTEKYVYHIEIPKQREGQTDTIISINRKGIATSILKKTDGKWKIYKTHTSARNNTK
jgi:ketosteroid isomerase-like protein